MASNLQVELSETKPKKFALSIQSPSVKNSSRKGSLRIRKLARRFGEDANMSDRETTVQKRMKFVAMGGSYLDAVCRILCTLISIAAFGYLSLYHMSTYRTEHSLNTCYAQADSE